MFIKKEKINKAQFFEDPSFGNEIRELDSVIDTYSIEYKTPNNDEIIGGYVCMPKIIKSKLPVLIYIRGGASINGRWDDRDASIFLTWLSSLGYIVIMSNLRIKDELGGAEIEDIYYLESLVKTLPEADLKNINIVSHSMGAINTYLILQESKFTNPIGKVIVLAGCSDTVDMMTRRPNLKTYWSQFYNTDSGLLNYVRSAVKWVELFPTDLNNLYILHGTKDERVDFFNFENLRKSMEKNNKKANFIELLDKGHNPNGFRIEIEKIL